MENEEFEHTRAVTLYEQDKICESRFYEAGECWHLYTAGSETEILFTSDLDFAFGMNIVGISADHFRDAIKIYTFTLMNNHIHVVLSGSSQSCVEFFNHFKLRLQYYFRSMDRIVDLRHFTPKLSAITELKRMRNTIAYVNRNGYKYRLSYNPFSYQWGAAPYMYNTIHKLLKTNTFSSLSITKRRKLLFSKKVDCSDALRYLDLTFRGNKCVEFADIYLPENDDDTKENSVTTYSMILPSSFCHLSTSQGFFRNNHNYFWHLTKNREADADEALRIGDTSALVDEDVYEEIVKQSQMHYGTKKISSLDLLQRIEIAKIMHRDFLCSGNQLKRILKLEDSVVNTLFPKVQD